MTTETESLKPEALSLPAKELKYILSFSSRDETRYNLMGVAFYGARGREGSSEVIAVASDGHRLVARIPRAVTGPSPIEGVNISRTFETLGYAIILNKTGLSNAVKLASKSSQNIVVDVASNMAGPDGGPVVAVEKIDGSFPDIRQVITPAMIGQTDKQGLSDGGDQRAVRWAVNARYLGEIAKVGALYGADHGIEIWAPSNCFSPMALVCSGSAAVFLAVLMPMRRV